MKSCQTFIPKKHPSPQTFFHSWLFGSMFVFILSLNHGFVHFCYFLKWFFFLEFDFLKIFNSKLWLITSSPWTDHARRFFFPYSVFCSFSLVPHCNSKFLKLECLDVFELRSFTTPRKFNCFQHANIFSYNPCQDLTSVLFQAHDSNTICFSKSCSN